MKNYDYYLSERLEHYLKSCEYIHKFASILKKHCEANKNSNYLYEVSGVINVIEEELNKLAYDISMFVDKNNEPILKNVLDKNQEQALVHDN